MAVAVVTGGASGFGLALGERCAATGMDVALLDLEEVAEQAVANLANGPTWFVGDLLRDGARQLGAMTRNDAVRLMIEMKGGVMSAGQEADA